MCARVNEIEKYRDKLYEINYSDQPWSKEREREKKKERLQEVELCVSPLQ